MTRRVIDSLDGPAGHSYGGAVITEAEKRELRQERGKHPYPTGLS